MVVIYHYHSWSSSRDSHRCHYPLVECCTIHHRNFTWFSNCFNFWIVGSYCIVDYHISLISFTVTDQFVGNYVIFQPIFNFFSLSLIRFPSNTHTHTHARTHTQPFNGLLSGTTRVGRYQKKHSPTHTHHDDRTSFIIFLHLQRSMASSLFSLRAWQSSRTTSVQVLFGLPLGLGPSTSYSMHFFTQLSSSFRSTCPYQRSLFYWFPSKFAAKYLLKIPPHLICITALPCETSISENERQLQINAVIAEMSPLRGGR